MDSTEMLDKMFGAAYYDKDTDRHVLDVHDASRIALDAARTADPGGLVDEINLWRVADNGTEFTAGWNAAVDCLVIEVPKGLALTPSPTAPERNE